MAADRRLLDHVRSLSFSTPQRHRVTPPRAWVAWSRFRVVIPTWDRTFGTLVACLDATLRRVGGAPTYLLTDNEKTG